MIQSPALPPLQLTEVSDLERLKLSIVQIGTLDKSQQIFNSNCSGFLCGFKGSENFGAIVSTGHSDLINRRGGNIFAKLGRYMLQMNVVASERIEAYEADDQTHSVDWSVSLVQAPRDIFQDFAIQLEDLEDYEDPLFLQRGYMVGFAAQHTFLTQHSGIIFPGTLNMIKMGLLANPNHEHRQKRKPAFKGHSGSMVVNDEGRIIGLLSRGSRPKVLLTPTLPELLQQEIVGSPINRPLKVLQIIKALLKKYESLDGFLPTLNESIKGILGEENLPKHPIVDRGNLVRTHEGELSFTCPSLHAGDHLNDFKRRLKKKEAIETRLADLMERVGL